MKNVIDEVLPVSRGVGEAEGYDDVLLETVASPEGCFPFLSGCNLEQVVSSPSIHSGIIFRFLKAH